MHDCLSGTLSKRIVEVGPVVLSKIVTREWLATVFVDSLHDLCGNNMSQLERVSGLGVSTYLVSSSISQPGEEGSKLAAQRRCCVIFENDLVKRAHRGDLCEAG